MVRYEKYILNNLLDAYENSLLFSGENKVNIHVSFAFTKKNIPEYFDESSAIYEEIHAAIRLLEQKGYIQIKWKKQDHIVQKVLLNEKLLEGIYRYVKRVPKAVHIAQTLQLLERLGRQNDSKTGRAFIDYLHCRISDAKSVKEYIDIEEPDKSEKLIKAIALIEQNQVSCYIREFSIRNFADSKVFEEMLPLIGKIMRRFGTGFEEMDTYAILAEYRIYHTPDYVYLKGSSGILRFGESHVVFSDLSQGVGMCGEDLANIELTETKKIKKVITIENLTTFFRWSEEDSLMIYLGGYHNGARRNLLQLIYRQVPAARYLHFGDIDVGGFEIYEDLRRRTGIPFQTYRMDTKTLKQYERYTKPLTANDRKRLERLIIRSREEAYVDTLQYMFAKGIKLEQEGVE